MWAWKDFIIFSIHNTSSKRRFWSHDPSSSLARAGWKPRSRNSWGRSGDNRGRARGGGGWITVSACWMVITGGGYTGMAGIISVSTSLKRLSMILPNTAMVMARAISVRTVVRINEMRLWRMATSCVVLTLARDARERLMTEPRVGAARTMVRGLGPELRERWGDPGQAGLEWWSRGWENIYFANIFYIGEN